jgi:polyisoprenoid-binding protein YceI
MSTSTTRERQTIAPAGVWTIDPTHSSVGFSVKHMMIATVRGRFAQFEGAIEVDESGAARIHGVVDAASIDTNESQRDEHLRSADFLDAAEHPEIRFRSTAVERRGDGEYRIAGEITIRGATREIALDAQVQGAGTDPWGNERVALEATGQLSRKDFGLTWNQAMEAGGVLVGDRVTLTLDLSTVRAEGV